ncbi:hypothetical protein [Amycolatopsis sp. NPDC021455]|uniref:hypothetical protein n=1 Tax=Amycolatopsis sp. NPDC021455 TaxID=3154901 RepID=UPI0033C00FAC
MSFPVEAPRPAQPPQPAEPPPASLPFPVAQIPGAPQQPAGTPQQAAWPPQTPTEPPQQAVWPSQPVPGAPQPADPPMGALRFLPAALVAVAAVLAALGAFLPLFLVQQHIGAGRLVEGADVTVVQSAWGTSYQFPGQEATDAAGSPVGIPLLAAVVLLTAAAYVAAARPVRALARALIVAGAAFTAGAVATVSMNGVGWSAMGDQIELDVVVAPGLWLLIGATLVAVVAAVVAHLAVRQAGGTAGWADPAVAYADTPTPPSGVAITVLPPDDDRP